MGVTHPSVYWSEGNLVGRIFYIIKLDIPSGSLYNINIQRRKIKMIGIYYWKNKLNNKYYIGQSVDINRRIIAHRSLAKNGKEDKLLYLSMRQHGIENFEWGVSSFWL